MGVHASGDGAAWDSLEALDVDQPHGLDYRESVHMAKAVRKRMDQEHVTFADATVGGIHMPGGVAVLGMELTDEGGDITAPVVGDGTYRARGLVWAWDGSSDARLWCSTKAAGNSTTGDWTLLVMHPDKQWGGRDVTWAGAHEFDASVDISGNVGIGGELSVDSILRVGGTSRFGNNVVFEDDISVDGTAAFGDASFDGTVDFGDDVAFGADISVDATAVFGAKTVMEGDVSSSPVASAWCSFCGDGANGDLGAGDFTGYNVNTVQKISSGIYEISFTNALPSADMAVIATGNHNSDAAVQGRDGMSCISTAADSIRIRCSDKGASSGTAVDTSRAYVCVFGY